MPPELSVYDLGFSWNKGIRGNKLYVQPSIYGESKPIFEENIKPNDFFYNDEIFVGDLAIRHSDIKYFSLNDDKTESQTSKILMQTGLGYLNGNRPFNLVTGLPVLFYFNQKESMENLIHEIGNSQPFSIKKGNGRSSAIKLNINEYKVLPQGYGVVMDYILNSEGKIEKKDIAKKKILAIDLGFYTLNLLGLDKMEIMKESTSIILGVEKAYRLLITYLQKHIGSSPSLYELDKFVIEGRYQGIDIRPLIKKAFKPLARQIQNEVEGLNINFDYYLIAGGAAHHIFEEMMLPNKILFDQLSQVRGYGKVGARLWKIK